MNLIEASITNATLCFADACLPLPARRDLRAYEGRKLIVGVRPNEFEDAALTRDASLPALEVQVDVIEELGAEMNVIFTLDAPSVVTDATRAVHQEAVEAEGTLLAAGDPVARAVCTAQVDARSSIRPGAPARLCVDVERLHFFDRESGEAVGTSIPSAPPA